MAYQAVFKRKEMKYLLDELQYRRLMDRIGSEIVPDGFPTSAISNLYYDTPDYRLIRASLEKPKYKEKLRLRSYQIPTGDTETFLEIKKKVAGIVYKRRETLPYRQAVDFLAQKGPGGDSQIFRELEWMLRSYRTLRPSMFLSYDRLSFQGLEDPLRLTFDRNILWRTSALDLSKGTWGQPLLQPGQRLMEIKITNAMPLWLSSALNSCQIYPVSFSKYGRAYETLLRQGQLEQEVLRYA